jgi:MFS family permease
MASLAQSESVLTSWLVLETTDSPLLLGLLMAIRFAPRVFGVLAGLLADRVDRRKLLIVGLIMRIAFSIIMGTLILGGAIEYWHIVLISLLQSVIMTFSQPAQSAFMIDLVGKDDVTNATALQRIAMRISGIIAPSLVGIFVNTLGIGVFFFINATILFLSVIPLLIIRGVPKIASANKSALRDLIEGFKYSWNNKGVLGGQLIVLLTNIFLWPCVWTLMPIYAKGVLGVDAAGLGWLTAVNRGGDFAVTMAIAHFGNLKSKGKIAIVSSLMWGVTWILFGLTDTFLVALIIYAIGGVVQSLTMMLSQVLLLINANPEMRGRVMGIRSLTVFPQSPASIIGGAASEILGPSITINLYGILFIISMIVTAKLVPSLQKQD